jgi:hypothetical protein
MLLPEPLENVTFSGFSPGAAGAMTCREGPVRIEQAEAIINTAARTLQTT